MFRPTVCHVNLARGYRGGERQTELLIRHLAGLTAGQCLVCRRDSPLPDRLTDVSDLEICPVGGRLGGHLRRIPADIIHAHEAKAVHWTLLENLLRGTPYIITRRLSQAVRSSLTNRLSYGRASALVGVSSKVAVFLHEIASDRISTIPDALAHLDSTRSVTEQIRARYQGKIIIGHIGAYVDRDKGQRVIIEAARILARQREDLVFMCLGAGCDEDALREESRDVPSVVWEGFQTDIGSYLQAFDLFVFPSRNEGLGSVLLDVMDHHVPIIAANAGGIPDIVRDQDTGILVDSGNARQLADALTRLLEDPQLARRLADSAAAALARFQPEVMAEQYLDIYRRILAPTQEKSL